MNLQISDKHTIILLNVHSTQSIEMFHNSKSTMYFCTVKLHASHYFIQNLDVYGLPIPQIKTQILTSDVAKHVVRGVGRLSTSGGKVGPFPHRLSTSGGKVGPFPHRLSTSGGKVGPFPHQTLNLRWEGRTIFLMHLCIIFSLFSLIFHSFLPQFSPPGGRLAHPRRPWLRHCMMLSSCEQNTGEDTLFMHHTDRVYCTL